jgi:hypothetical protein
MIYPSQDLDVVIEIGCCGGTGRDAATRSIGWSPDRRTGDVWVPNQLQHLGWAGYGPTYEQEGKRHTSSKYLPIWVEYESGNTDSTGLLVCERPLKQTRELMHPVMILKTEWTVDLTVLLFVGVEEINKEKWAWWLLEDVTASPCYVVVNRWPGIMRLLRTATVAKSLAKASDNQCRPANSSEIRGPRVDWTPCRAGTFGWRTSGGVRGLGAVASAGGFVVGAAHPDGHEDA